MNIINDPIVEQVRKDRNKHAAQCNYDLNAIYEDLKKQEKESKQRCITLQPKTTKKSV